MRVLTSTLLLATLTGCPAAMKAEPYNLSRDLYTWECVDHEDYTEVYVSTETCDDSVEFIVAELHLSDGHVWKTNLKTAYVGDCQWDEIFLLTHEYCDDIEGVALIAYAH